VVGLWLGKYVITPLGFIDNQTENILSIANLEAQNKKLPVEIKAEQPIKVDTQPDNPRLVIKEKLASAKKLEKINDTEQTVLTKNKADEATNINFQVNSIDGVSNEFLSRFQSAIDETSSEKNNQELLDAQRVTNTDSVRSLTDMPDWVQKAVPSLEFDMHIYSSDGEGWVRINGRDRYEGDKIAGNLFLNKILPQKVILTYQDKQFSLPALSNW
jgi:hypothetical protein